MNLTDSSTAKDTNVVLDTNLTEDAMNVVLRTTDLQHDFAFRNLFYLLYRQIILQVPLCPYMLYVPMTLSPPVGIH